MPIERPQSSSRVFEIALFVKIYHRLRDSHMLTSQCTRFESLTLKMMVKEVNDLGEHRHANVPCRRAYVCGNCRVEVQLFVRST